MSAMLLRGVGEKLHPQADAEQRLALLVHRPQDRLDEAPGFELRDRRAKGADAGQDQRVGGSDLLR